MLFLVIAFLVFITQTLFSHWWLIVVDCFVASFLVGKGGFNAFFSGVFGVGLVWLGQTLYTNSQNEGLLLGRMSELLGLGGNWIIAITVLEGALMGGMSALTGYYFKALWIKSED